KIIAFVGNGVGTLTTFRHRKYQGLLTSAPTSIVSEEHGHFSLKFLLQTPIMRQPTWCSARFLMTQILVPVAVSKLDLKEIESQLALCPSLPSLGSINKALQGLLHAEQRFSAQISEIVRRDPSLTSRLLRLVNSVYYGLSTPVNSIEEAVFYLGVRQIRQLTMVTPIIEDFQRLTKQCNFPW